MCGRISATLRNPHQPCNLARTIRGTASRSCRERAAPSEPAQARAEAQAALKLAETDEERRDAERVLEAAAKAGG